MSRDLSRSCPLALGQQTEQAQRPPAHTLPLYSEMCCISISIKVIVSKFVFTQTNKHFQIFFSPHYLDDFKRELDKG